MTTTNDAIAVEINTKIHEGNSGIAGVEEDDGEAVGVGLEGSPG